MPRNAEARVGMLGIRCKRQPVDKRGSFYARQPLQPLQNLAAEKRYWRANLVQVDLA